MPPKLYYRSEREPNYGFQSISTRKFNAKLEQFFFFFYAKFQNSWTTFLTNAKKLKSHWMNFFPLKFLLSNFFFGYLFYANLFILFDIYAKFWLSLCAIFFFVWTNAILEFGSQRLNKLDFWSKVLSGRFQYLVSKFLA